jgi:SfnB family sulfur acquisition oxidoreductase
MAFIRSAINGIERKSAMNAATPYPHPAPPLSGPVARIASDDHAIEVAHALAGDFAREASVRDSTRRLPWAELDRYSRSGLWGITVPREYGGAGVSSVTLAEVIAIISAADGSLGQIPQNHFYALEVLRVGATAPQLQAFYRRALEGQRFGNALAEIGHKDFKRRTRLIRLDDGSLRLTGRKFYCTGALYAHWIPTLAVSAEGPSFLVFVPRAAPGVAIVDDWDGFGQRITGSGSVVLENVHIEPEWVVPFQASFDRPTTIGPFAQLMHAAVDHGIADGAYAAALQFVREHARPWIDAGVERAADDPLTLERIGNLRVRLKASHAMLRRAGRLVDAAQAQPDEGSVAAASVAVAEARILSTGISLKAGSDLFELAGTASTLAEHNLDRYWRNARTHTLHDPVRWKFHAVGNYYLNRRLPPRHGAL